MLLETGSLVPMQTWLDKSVCLPSWGHTSLLSACLPLRTQSLEHLCPACKSPIYVYKHVFVTWVTRRVTAALASSPELEREPGDEATAAHTNKFELQLGNTLPCFDVLSRVYLVALHCKSKSHSSPPGARTQRSCFVWRAVLFEVQFGKPVQGHHTWCAPNGKNPLVIVHVHVQ